MGSFQVGHAHSHKGCFSDILCSKDTCSVPVVSNFTPINQPCHASISGDSIEFNATRSSKTVKAGRGVPAEKGIKKDKKRSVQAPLTTRSPKKPKRAGTLKVVHEYEVSKRIRGSSPQFPPVSTDTLFEIDRDTLSYDMKRRLREGRLGVSDQLVTDQAFESPQHPSYKDFEPPPSAQLPRTTSEEQLAKTDLMRGESAKPTSYVEDYIVGDAFFDASNISRMEQNCSPATVQGEPRASGLEIEDEDLLEVDFDDWSNEVSMLDAATVYRDDPERSNGEDHNPGATRTASVLNSVSGNVIGLSDTRQQSSQDVENEYREYQHCDLESSINDSVLPLKIQQASTPQTSLHVNSSPKLQWLAPKSFTPKKSPNVKLDGRQANDPCSIQCSSDGNRLPFARPSFPKSILPRSPILGLSSATVLRTCFRIGEALNAATQASRSNTDAVIELYARVSTSSRDPNGGFKQHFQFVDLFTDRPHLNATSIIWKGVGLWDQDSKVFLGEEGRGKMCRALGRIKKRDAWAGGCEMNVLSIWEVDWEDVGVAKGLVCS